MKYYIASDHAGFELKNIIKDYLKDRFEIIDLGVDEATRVDYPDFAHLLSRKMKTNNN